MPLPMLRRAGPVLRTVCTACTLLAFAGSALGQNALGDGTSLDRNLQVGSGGKNTRVRDYDAMIRFNQSVVTGTATGGKAFRGNLGYRPSDSFGARLGSNDLYTFRRDSSPFSALGTNLRGTDALRYQFGYTTGQVIPGYLSQAGVGAGGSLDRSASSPRPSGISSSLRSTADFLSTQSLRPSIIGYRANEQGVLESLAASPLRGLQWSPLDPSAPTDSNPSPAPGSSLPPDPLKAAADKYRRPTASMSGLEATAPGVPKRMDRDIATRALDLSVEPVQFEVKSEAHGRIMSAFKNAYGPDAVVDRTGEEPKADGSAQETLRAPTAWEAQLESLRRTLRGERPEPDAKPKADDPSAPKPEPKPEIGADGRPIEKPAPKPDDPTRPGSGRFDSSRAINPELIKALKQAGVRVDTFAPTTRKDNAAYADHMTAGQEMLSRGRFFDAEDRFVRAMSAMTGDPMAAAGRIHAQLGAGLYVSAATNLRALFTRHPELLAARYNPALVPTTDRSTKIAGQLREEMKRGSAGLGRDAALLLAYLGHIRDDAPVTAEGLKEMEARLDPENAGEAALLNLLKQVWAE